MHHFVTSKLFKVFKLIFFAKKQTLRNSISERRTLFFQNNKCSFARWRTCYGVTVTPSHYKENIIYRFRFQIYVVIFSTVCSWCGISTLLHAIKLPSRAYCPMQITLDQYQITQSYNFVTSSIYQPPFKK